MPLFAVLDDARLDYGDESFITCVGSVECKNEAFFRTPTKEVLCDPCWEVWYDEYGQNYETYYDTFFSPKEDSDEHYA